jgi:hypothetical protein
MNKRKEYGMLLDKINAAASKSELLKIKSEADTLYRQGCLKINEVNHIIELTIN